MSWGSLTNTSKIKYHVHINLHVGRSGIALDSAETEALAEFMGLLEGVGLSEDSFIGGGSGYEGTMHMTGKFEGREAFDRVRHAAVTCLSSHRKLYRAAYLESEAIPVDVACGDRPRDHDAPFPYQLHYGERASGVYKEAELHISARNRDLVDSKTHAELMAAGFYIAYLPKPEDTVAAVYTVNGTLTQMQELAPPTYTWLEKVGGLPQGTLKVEVMADFQVYDPGGIIEFMPLITEIVAH